jgi:DNA-binding response OmpR family regulator
VADARILKLLLVEDSLEDERLLSEALAEIEENRHWGSWYSAGITPTDNLADALYCLRRDAFDAVLLNLSLPDSLTLFDSFLEVSANAGGAPIIVLADEADEALATCLLRQGAQDVVVKSEIECIPFSRAVRYAIERERRVRCTRSEPPAPKTAMLAD